MDDKLWRRVTITHSRRPRLAARVKELLECSGFVPVVEDEAAGLPGIGAAVVFDERRIILLAQAEVELPEALRGVAVVRCSGETLDSDAALAFLAAINRLNSGPLRAGS